MSQASFQFRFKCLTRQKDYLREAARHLARNMRNISESQSLIHWLAVSDIWFWAHLPEWSTSGILVMVELWNGENSWIVIVRMNSHERGIQIDLNACNCANQHTSTIWENSGGGAGVKESRPRGQCIFGPCFRNLVLCVRVWMGCVQGCCLSGIWHLPGCARGRTRGFIPSYPYKDFPMNLMGGKKWLEKNRAVRVMSARTPTHPEELDHPRARV